MTANDITTNSGIGKGGGSTNPKKNKSNKKKQQQPQSSSSASPTQKQQQQQQKKKTEAPPPKIVAVIDPPLECPQSDFDALLGDAQGLANYEEAALELLDCARYGEVDACRAILDIWSPPKDNNTTDQQQQQPQIIVNAKDTSQSTPLHKACANGHTTTVQLLLSRGASAHLSNNNGNTPLHWASGSGHASCVKLLLDYVDYEYEHASCSNNNNNNNNAKEEDNNNAEIIKRRLDVLQKNNFGRSSLTEGFSSSDTQTVEYLLNHDSATEDKLIGGLDGEEVDDDDGAADDDDGADDDDDDDDDDHVATGDCKNSCDEKKKKKKKKGIVHEFDFMRGDEENERCDDDDKAKNRPSVLIRELPIKHADNPFGQAAIEDTTGLGIWCASLVMSRWLASSSMTQRMQSKTILELGAGCGIPALTAAVYGTPQSVIITDLNPETIDNIQHNIKLNDASSNVNDDTTKAVTTASSIDWGDESTYPSNKLDYVICSDCIYQKDIVPLLKKVVTGLLDPNHGTFLYVAPEGGRDGLPEFIAAMKMKGFMCVKEEVAPDVYRTNPLQSGDEEDCFLHFHELASTVYVLYEFQRC